MIRMLLFLVINIAERNWMNKAKSSKVGATKYTSSLFFKKAFSLAEVLITLAIIGVVAALTIPLLVQKYKEQSYVTATKKMYSVLSNAVQLAIVENGSPVNWGFALDNSKPMLDKIVPYMNYIKVCDAVADCISTPSKSYSVAWRSGGEIKLSGSLAMLRSAVLLNDGSMISSWTQSADCTAAFANDKQALNVCGEYNVDINGPLAGPNAYGKDVFIFFLTPIGVLPSGASNFEHTIEQDDTNNRFNVKHYKFDTGCLSTSSLGYGCAGWVIEKGNMDYWHCDDLSWDGKNKC